MARIDPKNKKIHAKVVYYGPGLCGKTTNLEFISTTSKGAQDIMSLATEGDRTIFFDFLPLEIGTIRGMATSFKLYTVPGQVRYNETRKMVLKNVDGVVFVADSQPDMMAANQESLDNLFENLDLLGIKRANVPLLLQYNKRDLPRVLSQRELDKELNQNNYPVTLASAVTGHGVMETLREICKLVLRQLSSDLRESTPTGVFPVASPAATVVSAPTSPPPVRRTTTLVSAPVRPPPVAPVPSGASLPMTPANPPKASVEKDTPRMGVAAFEPPPQAVAGGRTEVKATTSGQEAFAPQVLATVEELKQLNKEIAERQKTDNISSQAARILREVENLLGPIKTLGTKVGECQAALKSLEKGGAGSAATDGVAQWLEKIDATSKKSNEQLAALEKVTTSFQSNLRTLEGKFSGAGAAAAAAAAQLIEKIDASSKKNNEQFAALEKVTTSFQSNLRTVDGKTSGAGAAAADGISPQLLEKIEALTKKNNEQFAALEKVTTSFQANLRTFEGKMSGPGATGAAMPAGEFEKLKRDLLAVLPSKGDIEGITKVQSKPGDGGGETGKQIDAMQAKLLAMLAGQQEVAHKRLDALEKGVSGVLDRFDQRLNALTETLGKAVAGAVSAAIARENGASLTKNKPDAEAKAQPRSEANAKAEPEASAKPEAQTAADKDAKPAAKAEAEANAKPEAQTAADKDAKPAAEVKPAADAKAEASAPASPEKPATQESAAVEASKPVGDAAVVQKAAAAVNQDTKAEGKPAASKDAFADDPRHKAAARVARVMVADLYLYYKKDVEEGILQGDFEERNKDALADIRRTYASRVPEDVSAEKDHMGLALEDFVAKKRKELAQRPDGDATKQGEPSQRALRA